MPQRRSHLPIPSSTTPAAAKRALPLHTPSTSTPTRQSKRLKTSPPTKTTPKKSPYFEHSTSEEPEAESAVEREESGYEDEDASAVPSPPTSDAEDDSSEAYNSSDDDNKKPVLKKRGRKPNSTTAPTAPGRRKKERKAEEQKHEQQPGNELWRPGVKSHLPPGSAIFIPLPRARSPGTTPYTATTIHPNTFSFLRDLRSHNDRAWLQRHDADYRTSQADWASFVDSLTQRIIASVDDTIPDLPHRDLTFRIYRDVRFSSDPTPYKTHFSAAWSRTGRKGPYAAYYVQVQPGGGSFLGGGVWHPEAGPLGLLRRAVDRRGERLKAVLGGEGMRREFLGGVRRGDEKGCVMRFVEMNRENALKTKPKGFEADHPNIALLRLRNYTIGKKLKDEEVVGEGALERITELLAVLQPFITYLNSVVMPDEEGSDDEDEEDGDEDGEDEGSSDDEEVEVEVEVNGEGEGEGGGVSGNESDVDEEPQ